MVGLPPCLGRWRVQCGSGRWRCSAKFWRNLSRSRPKDTPCHPRPRHPRPRPRPCPSPPPPPPPSPFSSSSSSPPPYHPHRRPHPHPRSCHGVDPLRYICWSERNLEGPPRSRRGGGPERAWPRPSWPSHPLVPPPWRVLSVGLAHDLVLFLLLRLSLLLILLCCCEDVSSSSAAVVMMSRAAALRLRGCPERPRRGCRA